MTVPLRVANPAHRRRHPRGKHLQNQPLIVLLEHGTGGRIGQWQKHRCLLPSVSLRATVTVEPPVKLCQPGATITLPVILLLAVLNGDANNIITPGTVGMMGSID